MAKKRDNTRAKNTPACTQFLKVFLEDTPVLPPSLKKKKCLIISIFNFYLLEYKVITSSGLRALEPTAFSAKQNTAWRFSEKPCKIN